MRPSRNTIALLAASIAFIGIAVSLRIESHPTHERPAVRTATPPAAVAAVPSETFFTAITAQPPSTAAEAVKQTEAAQASTPAPPVPAVPADPVTADSYLVGDVSTGKIYYEKNPDQVLPFASMSKLITAIIATDSFDASTTIQVTDLETQVPPDASNLRAGEIFTLPELLYPMLLDSSNVAAEAIASSTARIAFLESMSSFAWSIGMKSSYFADPTGLSPHNQGTASDFFLLAQYLYAKRPDILAITRTVSTSTATTTDHGSHVFASIHPFVSDPRFIGGKTGHTDEALDTMLTIMNIQNHPIAFIVLHSSEGRAKDTQLLIERLAASGSAN